MDTCSTTGCSSSFCPEGSQCRSMNVSSVLECMGALLYPGDFTKSAKAIFQECKKLIGARAGYVAVLDETEEKNRVLFLDTGGMDCTLDTSLPMPIRGFRQTVYESGKTLYENSFTDNGWQDLLPPGHVEIENIMFIPLIHDGKVTGLLGLANKPGGFAECDAEVGTAFGRFASVALHNKMMTERLTESEEQYRSLVEVIPEAIFVVSDKIIIFANSAAATLLGAESAAELINRPLPDIIHPDDLESVRKNAPLIVKQQIPDTPLEIKLVRLDGSAVDVEFRPTSFTYEGKPTVLVIARDVTQQKSLEQENLNATKLEAVSILAGGVAHDFNNLLTVVLGNLSIAKMYAAKDAPLFTKLAEIERAALQTKELTHQLLAFTKDQTLQKKTVYIEELLGETIPFLLRGTNIKVRFNFTDGLPAVDIDSGQISQMINNLVINAIQAMPNGGTITVEAAPSSGLVNVPLEPDGYVKITFKDEGCGIPKAHLPRLFEPFFTTKAEGNGLGLATSYNIIKKHGGHLTVDSAVGIGTVFSVYLPASAQTEVEQEKAEEDLMSGKGKVLVMDDEKGVRKILTEMLELLGFDVECAATGEEAVFHYQLEEERGDGFDFVILDMTVRGGMGGEKTLRKLQAINPQVKALIASGYANADLLTDYEKHGFWGFVSKPFKLQELSNVLKKINLR
ncbi:MAG: ATP-binding protein [Bacillota bacterium]|nr:ATP-binding protein [Bacillota bacterium]MDW7682722.1 ATP-binding protein [Bacillota bacterium]